MVQPNISRIIENIELFSVLSAAEMSFLHASSSHVHYKRNETIIKQGSSSKNLVFFVSGMGKLYLDGHGPNRNLIVEIIKEKHLCGLSGLLDMHQNRFSVAALTPCSVLEIGKEPMLELLNANHSFAHSLLYEQAKLSNTYISRIDTLTNKQMHGRLADALLYLAEISGSYQLGIPVTRKEIAELSGLAPETATRLLNELINDGILFADGKMITILKPNLLTTLAQIG
jgi:CRP/FNR family transcriptional regulator, polysaccharide utilization system transcription regulator